MITNALRVVSTAIEHKPGARAFSLSNGDSGLVIRKDGRVELFQQGVNTAALQNEHSSMSAEDQQALLNGQLLMVLSIVANSPELQGTILSFAINEGVVGVPAANSNG